MAKDLLTEKETGTGVGVDLFMKKNKPGPTIGVGYTIEVFENGIKADEIKAKDKKEVKEIYDKFKAQYNTARAFQNENQIHITYKTKEERGEDVINPPEVTEEEQKQKEITGKREEVAMESIDKVLIKKANKIRDYLHRLVDPTAPVIIKYAEEEEIGTSVVPETPGTETPEAALESAVKNSITEVVKYVKEKSKEPKDTLYNGIKHWIAEVKKNIKNWEKMNKQTIDRKSLSQRIIETVQSGDPAKIKQVCGEDVTPEQATLLKEVSLMETGTPAQGQVSGGGATGEAGVDTTEKTTVMGSLAKAASSMEDKAVKILGGVNSSPENIAVSSASSMIQELIGDSPDGMEELASLIPETFEGAAVSRAIQELQEELANKEKSDSSKVTIEIQAKEFWNTISRIKNSCSIESAFEYWVNKNKIGIDTAKEVWKKINMDLFLIRNKTAAFYQKEGQGMFSINVSYGMEPESLLSMYVEWNNRGMNPLYTLVLVPISSKSDSVWKLFNNMFKAELSNEKLMAQPDVTEKTKVFLSSLISEKLPEFNIFLNKVIPVESSPIISIHTELKNKAGGSVITAETFNLEKDMLTHKYQVINDSAHQEMSTDTEMSTDKELHKELSNVA